MRSKSHTVLNIAKSVFDLFNFPQKEIGVA